MKPKAEVLDSLRTGEITFRGQFAVGTNHTFLVDVADNSHVLPAVYKPSAGERPLWDFPDNTLAHREVAAFETSEALAWDLVPPTVLREDGPAGPGSLQLYLDLDPSHHYFTFSEREKNLLMPAALFDALINNADRKGGHIVVTLDDRVRLIDHGICFHAEDKLRTVIWDFAGEKIPRKFLEDLEGLSPKLEEQGTLSRDLQPLLSPLELQALRDRRLQLLHERHFPEPGPRRNHPWPLV